MRKIFQIFLAIIIGLGIVFFCSDGASAESVSEEWTEYFNSDEYNMDQGNFVATDDIGNVYVLGMAMGHDPNGCLLKYDASGKMQWKGAKFLGKSGSSNPRNLFTDKKGNVYVALLDGFWKFDSNGKQTWKASPFSLHMTSDLAIDDAGNIYGAGSIVNAQNGLDAVLVKWDKSGNQLLTIKKHDAKRSLMGVMAKADEDGNIYFLTMGQYTSETSYWYLTRYNSKGKKIWQRSGQIMMNRYPRLVLGKNNDMFVSYRQKNDDDEDFFISRIDVNGNEIWDRNVTNEASVKSGSRNFEVDSHSNVYVAGYLKSSDDQFGRGYHLMKLSPDDGHELWSQTCYESEYAVTTALAIDESDYIYVTGSHRGIIATVKYTPDGDEVWRISPTDPEYGSTPMAITAKNQNVYVTGYIYATETGEDVMTVKYSTPVQHILTIERNSGITGKVTSSRGLYCGGKCTEGLYSDESDELKAVPYDGWKFVRWMNKNDGTYVNDNPLKVSIRKDTVLVPQFLPTNENYKLVTRPGSPPLENDQEVVVFTHGNNSEGDEDDIREREADLYRWMDFIKEALKDSKFKKKFYMVFYVYESDNGDDFNGAALGSLLDQYPFLQRRPIYYVSHSRGGNIQRNYMNKYILRGGKFDGMKAGENAKCSITLGTPHNGTPFADYMWMDFTFNFCYSYTQSLTISPLYAEFLWKPNHMFLLWNDISDILTNDTIRWDSAIYGKNFQSRLISNQSSLLDAYKEETYFDRLYVYGSSSLKPDMDLWSLIKKINLLDEHNQLTVSSLLMPMIPIIPNGYPDVSIDKNFSPFMANDGLVPLISALFLKPGSEDIFSVFPDGSVHYDKKRLSKARLAKEVHVLSRRFDHLDLITDKDVINLIVAKLKKL